MKYNKHIIWKSDYGAEAHWEKPTKKSVPVFRYNLIKRKTKNWYVESTAFLSTDEINELYREYNTL